MGRGGGIKKGKGGHVKHIDQNRGACRSGGEARIPSSKEARPRKHYKVSPRVELCLVGQY